MAQQLSLSDQDIAEVRKFAVKVAAARGYTRAADIVGHARVIADFVIGTNDAEVIAAARALAEKVG